MDNLADSPLSGSEIVQYLARRWRTFQMDEQLPAGGTVRSLRPGCARDGRWKPTSTSCSTATQLPALADWWPRHQDHGPRRQVIRLIGGPPWASDLAELASVCNARCITQPTHLAPHRVARLDGQLGPVEHLAVPFAVAPARQPPQRE